LGACLDPYGWNDNGLSQKRFENAIEELFPEEYKKHASNLYKDLRCGLLHIGIPGKNFGLTQKKESTRFETKHLKERDGKIVLISEEFYEDFVKACNDVMKKIEDKKIIHAKLESDILVIPEEQISTPTGISALSQSTSGCTLPPIKKM